MSPPSGVGAGSCRFGAFAVCLQSFPAGELLVDRVGDCGVKPICVQSDAVEPFNDAEHLAAGVSAEHLARTCGAHLSGVIALDLAR